MAVFFTADTHFATFDKDAFTRDYRPFKKPSKMNKAIIKIWNKQAKKGDTIYHIGDFISYNLRDKEFVKNLSLVKKIKADVIIVMGNNEDRVLHYEFNDDYEKFEKFMLELGFKQVIRGGLDMELDGNKLYLNHFPSKHKEGVINLFGHIHKSGLVKRFGFNVGVDNHYFKLFSEEDIKELEDRRVYFDEDVYC